MNKDILKTYAPSILLCGCVTGMFLTEHDTLTKRYKELSKYLAEAETNLAKYKRRVSYRFATNNYRKYHGLPMRRKGA